MKNKLKVVNFGERYTYKNGYRVKLKYLKPKDLIEKESLLNPKNYK